MVHAKLYITQSADHNENNKQQKYSHREHIDPTDLSDQKALQLRKMLSSDLRPNRREQSKKYGCK